MDSIISPVLSGLENAFQKHEKEVVIELAIDRILNYVGVYLVVGIAVLSKIPEFTVECNLPIVVSGTNHGQACGASMTDSCSSMMYIVCSLLVNYTMKCLIISSDDIACYVTNNTLTLDRGFMEYSMQYCRENANDAYACNREKGPDRILQNPQSFNTFVKCIPYFLLVEAFLFTLPSVWWHSVVGAQLIGHLNFSLDFLKDVYKTLKIIPAGTYRMLPYDKEGLYLDGWRRFRPNYKTEEQQGMDSGRTNEHTTPERSEKKIYEKTPSEVSLKEVIDATSSWETQEGDDTQEANENGQRNGNAVSKPKLLNRILCGATKDRHLFSMLCYENFASLEYQPYIMSVYALSSTLSAGTDRKDVVPLKQGILRQIFGNKNFTGNFLVKCYSIRYIYAITVTFVLLITCLILLGTQLYPAIYSKSFQCSVPLHGICLICTLKGHWDVTALFLVNICIVFVCFCLSVFQFYFVRFGSNRAVCHYFEDMGDRFCVALLSAHIAEKYKKGM